MKLTRSLVQSSKSKHITKDTLYTNRLHRLLSYWETKDAFIANVASRFETLQGGSKRMAPYIIRTRFRAASGGPRSPFGFEEAFKEG